MAVFSDLYDFILPSLPGAETGMVNLTIRRVLRDFFKRTTLYRESYSWTATAGKALYQLLPTAGAVHSILAVTVNGTPINAMNESDRRPLAIESAIASAAPTGWYSTYPPLITLVPTPKGGETITADAVLTVPLDNTVLTFPQMAFDEYGEEIGAGVVGVMMNLPSKPWSQSPDIAGMNLAKYARCVIAVRARLRDGGRPNNSTVHGPRFGA